MVPKIFHCVEKPFTNIACSNTIQKNYLTKVTEQASITKMTQIYFDLQNNIIAGFIIFAHLDKPLNEQTLVTNVQQK